MALLGAAGIPKWFLLNRHLQEMLVEGLTAIDSSLGQRGQAMALAEPPPQR